MADPKNDMPVNPPIDQPVDGGTTDSPPAAVGDQPSFDQNVLDGFQQFLNDNQLPLTLLDFVKQELVDGKTQVQIVSDLRQTPEYKAAYPENDLRSQNGFAWMPEEQIRAYRDEARRLSLQYLGYNPSNTEIANAIGWNKSPAELEHEFQVDVNVAKYGDTVKQIFQQELGYTPGDQRVKEFLDPQIPTPELDRAWEDALYRGRPEALGLGVRPQQEADLLRQYGVDVEQAFKGYQGVASELPRSQRLAAIETALQTNRSKFPPSGQIFGQEDVFTDVFKAIQLQDPEAIRKLQGLMSREVARFQSGGGAVRDQSGAAVGLLARSSS